MQHDLKYVTDDRGERIAVQISIAAYEALLEELEELDATAAFDAAMAAGETPIPFDQVFVEIEERMLRTERAE